MDVTNTRTATAASAQPPWLVAGVATAVLAIVWGVFGSIGVLLDPLAAEFGARREQLVPLFAAALAVHTVAARRAGRALDRFGPRPLLTVAGAGVAFGLLTPALTGSVPVAVAGYGLGLGLASAGSWVATTAAVGAAFRGRAAPAMGLLTAGPAAGGAVLAPAMTVLTQVFGVRATCASLALVGAGTCVAGALVLRVRPDPTATKATTTAHDLRPFALAAGLMGLVAFLPLVHAVAAAAELGLSATEGAAALTVVSTASAATRLTAGRLAGPGRLRLLYRIAHVTIAAAFVTWALAGHVGPAFPVLLAACTLFGAGYGAWLALGPAVLAATCPPERLGRGLGTLAAATGIGGVVGPVLASPLLAHAPTALWTGSAVIALLAAAVLDGTGRCQRRDRHDADAWSPTDDKEAR